MYDAERRPSLTVRFRRDRHRDHGAMATDGYKRVRADAPIDALDDIDDWLSEVTYIMILAIFITGRASVFSLDNLLF